MNEVLKELCERVKVTESGRIYYENVYGDMVEIQVWRSEICYLPECNWISKK